MSLSETVAALVTIREGLNVALTPILQVLKDKSLPLDERWTAYTDLVKADILVNNETFGNGFDQYLEGDVSLYDDFNIDKGQSTQFIDMYERIIENADYNDNLATMRDAGLTDWQEAVLASGYSSFTYDW